MWIIEYEVSLDISKEGRRTLGRATIPTWKAAVGDARDFGDSFEPGLPRRGSMWAPVFLSVVRFFRVSRRQVQVLFRIPRPLRSPGREPELYGARPRRRDLCSERELWRGLLGTR